MSIACKHNTAAGSTQTRQSTRRLFWCSQATQCVCAVCDQEKCTNAAVRRWGEAVRRRVCRIDCITRAPRGAALAVFFHFACVFFWQRAVNLGFFHSEALHVRAQVSDSRRASPTRRVRIFCIRPAWRVFGGRIRERGSPRLGAKRAPTHTACDGAARAQTRHAICGSDRDHDRTVLN